MSDNLSGLLLHWGALILALWLVGQLLRGVRFETPGALLAAALVLGLANAYVRPLILILTLPLTLVTLGLFLLVVNALMVLLTAWLVRGFKVDGFWTAMLASVLVSLFSLIVEYFADGGQVAFQPQGNGTWV